MKIIGFIMMAVGWFLIGWNWGIKEESNFKDIFIFLVLVSLVNFGHVLMYN